MILLFMFLSFRFQWWKAGRAQKRGASIIEKNLYVIGQKEKRQGYNAGINK